jgi:hypothetical protein
MFYDSYTMYLFSPYFDFWVVNFSESGALDRLRGAEKIFITILRNVGTWIPFDTALCPRGLEHAATLLWEPRISNYITLFLSSYILLLLPAFIHSSFLFLHHLDDQVFGNELKGLFNISEVFSAKRSIMFRFRHKQEIFLVCNFDAIGAGVHPILLFKR